MLRFYNIAGILYQIRKITLEDGSFMYCLWIAKDLEDQDLGSRFGTLTLASKNSSTLDKSLGEVSFFLLQIKWPSNISYPH